MSEIIDELKNMPMLYFSLGGKELFHSNFLYWLATDEKYKHKTYQVLKELAGIPDATWNETNTHCEREYHNFDFSIWKNGEDIPVLLIENKVKSIPNVNQLNGYTGKIGEEIDNTSFILLSLMPLMSDGKMNNEEGVVENTNNNWHYVGYRRYSEMLRKHFGEDERFIAEYCDFVDKLAELAKTWIKDFATLKKIFFDQSKIKEYEVIRMDDVYEKLRVSYVASLLDKVAMKDAEIETGYTRKTGTIDISNHPIRIKDGIDCLFRLQIQGDTYKRCFVIRNKAGKAKNDESRKEIWNAIIADENIKSFFFFENEDSTSNCNLWDNKKGKQKQDGCNKYITNNEIFLYRYKCLKEGITIEDVKKKIVEDFSRISNLTVGNKLIEQIENILK